mmetsp:Transcript_22899/g.74600  ORF Transcript_22899/g.74600 Transcript_22899/m.74600 type:complete len:457 (-) Transcript_22899:889-2259(-)
MHFPRIALSSAAPFFVSSSACSWRRDVVCGDVDVGAVEGGAEADRLPWACTRHLRLRERLRNLLPVRAALRVRARGEEAPAPKVKFEPPNHSRRRALRLRPRLLSRGRLCPRFAATHLHLFLELSLDRRFASHEADGAEDGGFVEEADIGEVAEMEADGELANRAREASQVEPAHLGRGDSSFEALARHEHRNDAERGWHHDGFAALGHDGAEGVRESREQPFRERVRPENLRDEHVRRGREMEARGLWEGAPFAAAAAAASGALPHGRGRFRARARHNLDRLLETVRLDHLHRSPRHRRLALERVHRLRASARSHHRRQPRPSPHVHNHGRLSLAGARRLSTRVSDRGVEESVALGVREHRKVVARMGTGVQRRAQRSALSLRSLSCRRLFHCCRFGTQPNLEVQPRLAEKTSNRDSPELLSAIGGWYCGASHCCASVLAQIRNVLPAARPAWAM